VQVSDAPAKLYASYKNHGTVFGVGVIAPDPTDSDTRMRGVAL